jgi:3-vinyl bacteriochlorophyllide hydratase
MIRATGHIPYHSAHNRIGLGRWIDGIDACPWGAVVGRHSAAGEMPQRSKNPAPLYTAPLYTAPLYTQEERRRRDASPWTIVQGVLAPVQFLIFLISLGFVLHYVFTGQGWMAASLSVVIKTGALYAIMITGAIWERAVFGRYLFAPAFFWEDAFSMLVLALHTLYVAALFAGALTGHSLMLLALAAYASYVINAAQFVMKLRTARRQTAGMPA